MQRPRRTTELHEVPGTATKRVSRHQTQQQRLTTASPFNGTAIKYLSKQNRTARNSSQERASTNAYLSVPSTVGGKTTPQKTTPLTKTSANRILFTAEKRSTATSATTGGALHNDKKWVQEQTQRIMDYLEATVPQGAIPGIGTDFFGRGGGLRHMSIKQFVGIINFFLHQISGNRLVVGTNHVEEIVSILQKLNYPYQVNKSWLKTPNTQHSFGNVIVLLDFLMDLVVSDGDDIGFDFQEPAETTISSFIEPVLKPDGDFLAQLLQDTEEGWGLWNEQLMDEYSASEQKTCNLLIQKLAGLQTLEELDADVERLKQCLSELEKARPVLPKEQDQLHADLKYTLTELQMLRDDIEADDLRIKKLELKKQNEAEDMRGLSAEVNALQNKLKQQQYTTEDFDKLIVEVDQLKHMHKIQERTVADLRDRNHNQQVQLSRAKKQLTDQVEQFNAHMREICFSDANTDNFDLQLPLNPEQKHLSRIVATLQTLSHKFDKLIQAKMEKWQQYQKENAKLNHNMNMNLIPKKQSLQDTLNAAENEANMFNKQMEKERAAYSERIMEIDEEIQKLQAQATSYRTMIKEKKDEVKRLEALNEETMASAERHHKECVETRAAYLDKYETALGEAEAEIEQLTAIVQQIELQQEILKHA